jgi:hypothetical protein
MVKLYEILISIVLTEKQLRVILQWSRDSLEGTVKKPLAEYVSNSGSITDWGKKFTYY